MTVLKSGSSVAQADVEAASKALRVILYGPNGEQLVSQMRGGAKNLRTDGGLEERDGVAVLLPGTAASQIGGTATAPFRTDPTGTTTQPVSGTLGASLRVAGADVAPANPVPVAFPGVQPVAFTSRQPVDVTFPATQLVSGSVNANVRAAGADVTSGNRLPVDATGTLTVNAGSTLPVVVLEATDAAAEFTSMIDIVPAAALADGATLWALRNNSTKTIGVRRLDLQQGFTGTAVASRSAYVVQRTTGAAPTGGTAVVPAKKLSTSVETTAAVVQSAAAMTVTSTTFGSVVHKVASANQLAATTTQDLEFKGGPLLLAPNEGIAVRASGAVVLGSFLVGSLGWYEL